MVICVFFSSEDRRFLKKIPSLVVTRWKKKEKKAFFSLFTLITLSLFYDANLFGPVFLTALDSTTTISTETMVEGKKREKTENEKKRKKEEGKEKKSDDGDESKSC